VLRTQAARGSSRPAIQAPGRPALGYGDLAQLTETIGRVLRHLGYGPADRLMMALPNGPEAAVAFLALAGVGACCPVDPALTAREIDEYMALVRPAAVLLQPGFGAAMRAASAAAGVPVLELVPDPGGPAGACAVSGAGAVSGAARRRDAAPGGPATDAYSLLLPTSGSTSRPKLVPLRASTMIAGAEASRRAYGLGPTDCRLNVMPLFHIQGLVGSVLASLVAGGRVVCAPAFEPDAVLRWLDEYEVTWFSGSPTMHASLLAAGTAAARSVGHRLRFVRSGSAPLRPELMAEMEELWGVPVVESYGMTEAHQIASNPLPPGQRRPGTVGLPTGAQVAVRINGRPAAPGEPGEIIVRGANVVTEYLASAEVNAASFVDGWFRTGDTGVLDEDGYLTLTGRLTEIINRGGDKVQPREVDAVLEAHPAVARALAFGVPHPTLTQEVAAAVVLRSGARLSHGELEQFAAERLAPHKRPRRIVTVTTLPTHGTGKVRRGRLAEELGMTFYETHARPAADERGAAPRTATQAALVGIWAQALNLTSIGVDDDFFEAGGDSLSGMRLLDGVEQIFGVEVPPMAMYDTTNTVARMAAYIEEKRAAHGS
jgi:acyl-CoA synthetase (AMP-forming)/AMP-acid ligase II/acyl carrier protein